MCLYKGTLFLNKERDPSPLRGQNGLPLAVVQVYGEGGQSHKCVVDLYRFLGPWYALSPGSSLPTWNVLPVLPLLFWIGNVIATDQLTGEESPTHGVAREGPPSLRDG